MSALLVRYEGRDLALGRVLAPSEPVLDWLVRRTFLRDVLEALVRTYGHNPADAFWRTSAARVNVLLALATIEVWHLEEVAEPPGWTEAVAWAVASAFLGHVVPGVDAFGVTDRMEPVVTFPGALL